MSILEYPDTLRYGDWQKKKGSLDKNSEGGIGAALVKTLDAYGAIKLPQIEMGAPYFDSLAEWETARARARSAFDSQVPKLRTQLTQLVTLAQTVSKKKGLPAPAVKAIMAIESAAKNFGHQIDSLKELPHFAQARQKLMSVAKAKIQTLQPLNQKIKSGIDRCKRVPSRATYTSALAEPVSKHVEIVDQCRFVPPGLKTRWGNLNFIPSDEVALAHVKQLEMVFIEIEGVTDKYLG